MSVPRIIAFYLPQFHPIPENDEWWGKGFTEWTNVAKAKPLFWGHKQPKIPADLGFYDLRVPETRITQAEMAKKAGIEGFCYWHYWFGNGKQLLERPFNEVLKSGKPDFPFCLGWANHDWEKKLWDPNEKKNVLLIKQEYPGEKDIIGHFNAILPALQDKRYIKVERKPLFFIYRPLEIPDPEFFLNKWNKMAKENGLEGIFFVAQIPQTVSMKKWIKLYTTCKKSGYDAVFSDHIANIVLYNRQKLQDYFFKLIGDIFKLPASFNFLEMLPYMNSEYERKNDVFPGIICSYDHTPRSGRKGRVITNFNARTFAMHIDKTFELIKDKPGDKKIVFLKSWNEWGEGNFMEPDLDDGFMKINTLKTEIEKFFN